MDGSIPAAGPHLGRVTDFDAVRGLGSVQDLMDATLYPFHATAIADGSRTIEIGARVTFTVTSGHGGRDEAQVLLTLPA
jgi:cold shock CspA family protein